MTKKIFIILLILSFLYFLFIGIRANIDEVLEKSFYFKRINDSTWVTKSYFVNLPRGFADYKVTLKKDSSYIFETNYIGNSDVFYIKEFLGIKSKIEHTFIDTLYVHDFILERRIIRNDSVFRSIKYLVEVVKEKNFINFKINY